MARSGSRSGRASSGYRGRSSSGFRGRSSSGFRGRSSSGYRGRVGSPIRARAYSPRRSTWIGSPRRYSPTRSAPYWRSLGYTYPAYNYPIYYNWSSYYPSAWYDYYGYDYLRPYYADQVVVSDLPEQGALVGNGQCIDTNSNDPALVGNAFFAGQTCASLQSRLQALQPPPSQAADPAPNQETAQRAPASAPASPQTLQPVALVPVQSSSNQAIWLVLGFGLIGALLLLLLSRR